MENHGIFDVPKWGLNIWLDPDQDLLLPATHDDRDRVMWPIGTVLVEQERPHPLHWREFWLRSWDGRNYLDRPNKERVYFPMETVLVEQERELTNCKRKRS